MQYAQQQMAQAGQAMAAMNQTLGTQGTVVNGVEGSAVIKSSQDTGQQQNLNPVYQLDLVVTVPGEQAYELTTHSEVNTMAVGNPRAQVPVKVDPSNPSSVVVEWMKVVGS